MDRELLKEFWKQAVDTLQEAIRLTKEAGLENEQEMLDFIDQVNKLSIEF